MCFPHAQYSSLGLAAVQGLRSPGSQRLLAGRPSPPRSLPLPVHSALPMPHREEVLPSPDKPNLLESSFLCQAGRTQPKLVPGWSPEKACAHKLARGQELKENKVTVKEAEH